MGKFIECFNEEDKTKLIEQGYKYLGYTNSSQLKIYYFLNDNDIHFSLKDIECFETNTLCFNLNVEKGGECDEES